MHKETDYILNTDIMKPRYLNGVFEAYSGWSRNGINEQLDRDLALKSMEKHCLGELDSPVCQGQREVAGEWGNAFMNLNEKYDGIGQYVTNAGWSDYKPDSRQNALTRIHDWLFKQHSGPPYNLLPGASGMSSLNGHTLFEHYAGEFGFDYIGAELGESIASTQVHIAFVRGAARQYGKIGFTYFSNWFEGRIGTHEEKPSWPQGGPLFGHSLNLLKRTYIASYMGNMSSFCFEAGSQFAFYGPSRLDENGLYQLTPYGEMMQELVSFSTRNPDIGIAYTPFGIVIDKYHGIVNFEDCRIARDKAFGFFDNTPGDEMTWDLIDMFFPDNLFGGDNISVYGTPPEENFQVNGPYGDTCDFLLQNASQDVLNSYRCLILSGDLDLSVDETKVYINYVRQGGILILNTAFLKFFPEYKDIYAGNGSRQDITDGKGTVIVSGKDHDVGDFDVMIREKLAEFIPFTISEQVEYMINVKDSGLIVTLINNDGVKKPFYEEPVIDEDKSVKLELVYTGDMAVESVRELISGTVEIISENSVEVYLGPGDSRVYEFILR